MEKNSDNLAKMLPGAAKYYLTQGEIVSNGAYYNALVPNMIPLPPDILQPFLDYAFGFRRGVDAGQPRTTPARALRSRSPSTAFRSQETFS